MDRRRADRDRARVPGGDDERRHVSSAHSRYHPGSLAIFLIVVGVAGLVCGLRVKRPAWLAVSAGLLWATSDTSIKALSSHLSTLGIGVVIQPLAVVILVASLVGLLISARSLQLGDAVPMIALTSAAANLTTIAAGPLVFGEPWPQLDRRPGDPDRGVRAGDRRRVADAAAVDATGRGDRFADRARQHDLEPRSHVMDTWLCGTV